MYSMWGPAEQHTRYTAKGRLSAHNASHVDKNVDVLLTVHLSIILAVNQLNAQNLLL